MALTSKQRAKLPPSAFVYPKSRKYPVPTKAQARKAGISERERIKIHRAAKSYAARKSTKGTPARVNAVVHKRGPLKPKGRRK
jgi:Holliday junction resolvase-like predicted endonuclease